VVAERLGREARSGALFVFFGFRSPKERAAVVAIEERALDDLLDGIDLEAPSRSRRRLRLAAWDS